jgi:hypothetical protein
MVTLYHTAEKFFKDNRDDLEYLLFIGLPTGVILVIVSDCMNFLKLF